jgi:hypothetical protein
MKYLLLALMVALAGCNDSTPQKGAMHDYTTVIPNTQKNLDAALHANDNKLKDADEGK